jgi:hypothetical protein
VKLARSCTYEASTILVAYLIQTGGRIFVSTTCLHPLTRSIHTRKPPTGPLAPQQPADLPPDEPPAPGPEGPRPPAWRSIRPRGGFGRGRKKTEARPAGPIIETVPPGPPPGPPPVMPPDRAQATRSWDTWQGKCARCYPTKGNN